MLTVLFAAAALTIPVAPAPAEQRFGKWSVACDNHWDCGAVGVSDEATETPEIILHVQRSSGPSAPVELSAARAFEMTHGLPVRLTIDGRKTHFGFDRDGQAIGDPVQLLRAVAAGRSVEATDDQGRKVGIVPTAGASAALRFMDDRQGRDGTITAIVAHGAKPAASVPSPPPLLKITQPQASPAAPTRLKADQLAAIEALSDQCDNPVKSEASPRYDRLDARHTLALIPCFFGAYQTADLIVVVDNRGDWALAKLEQPAIISDEVDAYDASSLVFAEWDAKKRLLKSWAKGRGLGDCGNQGSWVWDGRIFRLAYYAALEVCGGAEPGQWLPRWKSAHDETGE